MAEACTEGARRLLTAPQASPGGAALATIVRDGARTMRLAVRALAEPYRPNVQRTPT